MTMKLTSSWMNEIVQLQKDQELGQFSLEIPVDSSQLDRNGFFRYIRKDNEVAKYKIRGESLSFLALTWVSVMKMTNTESASVLGNTNYPSS